jgi:hypothetical protein
MDVMFSHTLGLLLYFIVVLHILEFVFVMCTTNSDSTHNKTAHYKYELHKMRNHNKIQQQD